jgi:UDP-N-acetylglucosamine 4-epimerase
MFLQYHSTGELSDKSILITGGAGFIGSNIAEYLLQYGAKKVRVVDNLLTGFETNLVPLLKYPNFEFLRLDISDLSACQTACEGIDIVCHQAALGSVPRSVSEPHQTVKNNIDGFVNMAFAAHQAGIRRFVYASSSSVYGDEPNLPKIEPRVGKLLSPYAVSKWTNELFAQNFAQLYDMEFIGFRYFNVFGRNQSPKGAYAAVIPLFISACLRNEPVYINGDGSQTRDFTYVENVVQANVRAMLIKSPEAVNQAYNIGFGGRYSLLELFELIKKYTDSQTSPTFRDKRAGDIWDSQADIQKARTLLGYEPLFSFEQGLEKTISDWKIS